MTFKLYLLIGAFALLMCSTVDADMKCIQIRNENKVVEGFGAVNDVIAGVATQCPPLISITSPPKEYCCYNTEGRPHCCELGEFVLNMSIIAVVLLIILMVLSTIVSCICCLCCPCCYVYKRRHTGRVYGRRENTILVSSNTKRSHTEYQPIVRNHPHIPAGAYQVFPPRQKN